MTPAESEAIPVASRPRRKNPVHLPNVARHNQPTILFVTVCAHRRQKVLANQVIHETLLRAWNSSQSHRVGFYMIMPDHIHLFCSPTAAESENVRHWVGYWKRIVSCTAKDSYPLWQRDCWDTQLRDVSHYGEKWQYVARNPVRRGLVPSPEAWGFKGMLHELRW